MMVTPTGSTSALATLFVGVEIHVMVASGLPDLDVARVLRCCASRVPEQLREQIRVECGITPRHLRICECRPPWREDVGPEWTRFPIARLGAPW